MNLKNKTLLDSFKTIFSKKINPNTIKISSTDIQKSKVSMDLLCEYIRYCYYDAYICTNPEQLQKYCRLLLKFENCTQAQLIQYCNQTIKKLLLEANIQPYNTKSVDISLNFAESNNQEIIDLCDTLMDNALSTKVKGIH